MSKTNDPPVRGIEFRDDLLALDDYLVLEPCEIHRRTSEMKRIMTRKLTVCVTNDQTPLYLNR
jgi:hypothetical protein